MAATSSFLLPFRRPVAEIPAKGRENINGSGSMKCAKCVGGKGGLAGQSDPGQAEQH